MQRSGKRKVGVALSTELACYREMIRGINAFAKVQSNWRVEHLSIYADLPRLVADNHFDGVLIGGTENLESVKKVLHAVNGRAVGIGGQFAHHGIKCMVEVESDDLAVGRMAAEHFLAKGFQHFGFIGIDTEWSELRETGYVKALDGFNVAKLRPEAVEARDSRGWGMPYFGKNVFDWIRQQPKPLALFACNDLRGRVLIDLCRNEEIRVPDEVAILAVDNDDLICDLSQPQLSSVAVPWKKIGFRAATALERLLSHKNVKPRRILVGPECVVERQSSDTLAVADPDVAAALQFIRAHAHEPINVADIMNHLPVARRSLERRFREIMGRSPLEEIRNAHAERAKYLLAESNLSMPEVAEKSGYSSAAWMSKAFRDTVGDTPSAYRKRFNAG